MARLTKRDGGCNVPCWQCNSYAECTGCDHLYEITTRLAIYETATHTEDGTEILSVEEIAELARAKQDGRLVVLPCKIGDDMFRLSWDIKTEKRYVVQGKIKNVRYDSRDGCVTITDGEQYGIANRDGRPGIKAYLSREEAEKVLEGMK